MMSLVHKGCATSSACASHSLRAFSRWLSKQMRYHSGLHAITPPIFYIPFNWIRTDDLWSSHFSLPAHLTAEMLIAGEFSFLLSWSWIIPENAISRDFRSQISSRFAASNLSASRTQKVHETISNASIFSTGVQRNNNNSTLAEKKGEVDDENWN